MVKFEVEDPIFRKEELLWMEAQLAAGGKTCSSFPTPDRDDETWENEFPDSRRNDLGPEEMGRGNMITITGERQQELYRRADQLHRYHPVRFSPVMHQGPPVAWTEQTVIRKIAKSWVEMSIQKFDISFIDNLFLAKIKEPVEQVVCFGLGRLVPLLQSGDKLYDDDPDIHMQSWDNTAVVAYLATHLRKVWGRRPRVVCQDLQYTNACREALAAYKIEAIDCFGATTFTMINEKSIVVVFGEPAAPVREIVADLARPLAMWWRPRWTHEQVDDPEHDPETWNPDSKRSLQMLDEWYGKDIRYKTRIDTKFIGRHVWCFRGKGPRKPEDEEESEGWYDEEGNFFYEGPKDDEEDEDEDSDSDKWDLFSDYSSDDN
ncbi:hypothetical protein JX265_009473 [Neoarthrinium moseri]|uniref:SRR1-like domain-containing protein n=1 Tax=Neoarthrinium moseri TaxID=1658444 RepID=A0A9P9WFZ9_9PEZI|nr:hypothetical protein JX265_009473 [Neoarthrinium moseri]